ncbi:acyl-CoA synthetase (NDP forming) [Bacillus oleivorans]|uniref:Acyl-CoA synthetase (NDP forming) n=1 Tax=Bacillus oleivorans TaxID=1448271 RepID=A0A285CID6_9BACI|nr:CoA-binding protein [Bacillus oleivorans]SNX67354.1 acyl-CoA synthetase (NDP forming) [Bacillus oleivorans]
MRTLQPIVSPKSIAIIGASERFHHNAGRVMINLQKSNFTGEIYLVNPNYESISGIQSYPSVLDIKEEIDLACVIVPYIHTQKILKECVKKQVKSVIIISSGFSESGADGIVREKELQKIIKGTETAVYGPNSPGFYHYIANWGISFSPRFEPKNFRKGSVGLISHGGSLGRAVLDANEKGLGFSYWLSPGNEMDINMNDCFEFLIHDPSTETILLIIESVSEEERFFRLLHQAYIKQKPVILLPIGHSKISRIAVKHHLGRHNDYAIPWDMVHHPGLIKAQSIDEVVAVSWLFDTYKKARGERTVIFSWAGATSIYLADLCAKYGISLPSLSADLQKQMTHITGIEKAFMNPLDLTTIVYDDLSKLTCCLEVLLESGDFDNIIVPFPFQVDYQNEILARKVQKLMHESNCIFIPIFMSQGYQNELAIDILKETKKPYFIHENTAIKSFSAYVNYSACHNREDGQNEKTFKSG